MARDYTYAVLGDSQTDKLSPYGARPDQRHPELVAELLRKQGHDFRGRNFGLGGQTTLGPLGSTLSHLVSMCLANEVPDIAAIFLGTNDVGVYTSAQTQTNTQALIKCLKYDVKGPAFFAPDDELVNLGAVTVATETALPAIGKRGQRYVVLTDGSTTGGAAADASDPEQHATITGTVAADALGNKQTVWEYRNPLAGVYGWGRVATNATAPWGCTRVVVISDTYRNWTAGGDTPSTPEATHAAVRAATLAAVAAENVAVSGVATVVFADLYALMLARIVAGTDPDFSAVAYDQARSWSGSLNNQHHNPYGDWLVARAARAAIPNAWLTSLY